MIMEIHKPESYYSCRESMGFQGQIKTQDRREIERNKQK